MPDLGGGLDDGYGGMGGMGDMGGGMGGFDDDF